MGNDWFNIKRTWGFVIFADPTYMIRAVPSNASDNVYCTLLAQSAVHGAMAGYTGFTVGSVNGRNAYIPFYVSHSISLKKIENNILICTLCLISSVIIFSFHEI